MRARGLLAIGGLVGLGLVMAASATAETLVVQPPGPSGVAVRSDEPSERNEALDDFVVPVAEHWHLEGIQVFGQAASEHPRTFNVKILWGGGGTPSSSPDAQLLSERVTVAGGPNYLIPIAGAPRLDHANSYESGQYWISVQAVSSGGEDDWSWLTGPDTPGTAPAYLRGYTTEVQGAEPGLAFQLLGTATQIVKASTYGAAGAVISNPPGISCPGACMAEFSRGTMLSFTPIPAKPSLEFTEWGFRGTGFTGRSNELVPIQIPSPCSGTGGCAFALTQDTNVGAIFEPIDEVTVLRVAHHRRTGTAGLVVSVPGAGFLGVESSGLRSYFPRAVSAGIVSIPLRPTKKVATSLRQRGRATVSLRVEYRATEASYPGTTRLPLTLIERRPGVHKHRRH